MKYILNFAGTKNKFFFLQGPKLKRGTFAGTSTIFKPLIHHYWINGVGGCWLTRRVCGTRS